MTPSLQLNYLPRINRAGERQSYGTNARVDFSTKSTVRLKKVSCRNSECVPIRHFGDIQVEVTDLLKNIQNMKINIQNMKIIITQIELIFKAFFRL